MRPWVFTLLLLTATGCTHTRVIERSTAGPDAFRSATGTLANREGEVLTLDGEVLRWHGVRVTPDSTFGVPLAPGLRSERVAIPTERFAEATVRSRGRGILDGALIGAGAGVLLGLIAPVDPGCADFYGPCPETRIQQALLVGVGGALSGVIFGAIFPAKLRVRMR